jgi:hypothetical protein
MNLGLGISKIKWQVGLSVIRSIVKRETAQSKKKRFQNNRLVFLRMKVHLSHIEPGFGLGNSHYLMCM